MADYLSNLIARNLFPQEKIEPRLPARFEPTQEARLAAPLQEVDQSRELPVEPAREGTAREVRRSRSEISLEQERPTEGGDFEQRLSAHSHVDSAGPEPADQPYRGRLDLPEREETVREVSDVGRNVPRTANAEPANRLETAKAVTTSEQDAVKVVVKNAPATAEAEPANGPKTAEAVTTNLTPGAPVRNNRFSGEARSNHFSGSDVVSSPQILPDQPQSQQSSTAPTPEPAANELRPSIPQLPDLAPRNPPAQPPPTIHVSIGRIEVRANPAPSAPLRKPSPAAKIMSLDEYLQSRSNGGGS